jgi:hypothetical protein
MTMETVKNPEPIQSTGRQFYHDLIELTLRPGSFYAALPETRSPRDGLLFMVVMAAINSVPAAVFTTAPQPMFSVLHLMNALLMPVLISIMLYLFLRVVSPGRFAFGTLFTVAAYANVVLLVSWIPGMAPWAELFKYGLIGLGLTQTGGVSGWKAFVAIAATAASLVMIVHASIR